MMNGIGWLGILGCCHSGGGVVLDGFDFDPTSIPLHGIADRQHPTSVEDLFALVTTFQAEVQELRNSQNDNRGPHGNGQGGGGSNDDSDPHSDGGSDSDDDTGSNSGDNTHHTNTQRTTRMRTHVSDSIAGGATKSKEEDQPFSDEIMAYRIPSNLTSNHFEVLQWDWRPKNPCHKV
ncbi:hypothetical protein PIB30_009524 [Stylosanthes scabra]|uniref:Uncharacterized protein n=1 Tax=Stylosanthes scabra TaxID=79078 RepID=A0ABU6Z4W5_9FABA|nr:hypothetical protein [Stylosanthes scabra]